MPGSRTTLPHTALTLLLTAPLSCAPDPPEGQVTDPHGCRTIILPNDPTTTTSSSTTATDATSTTTEATTSPSPACGDGNLDDGEHCDNGPDNADTAACTSTCALAKCGDTFIQTDIEECDDGNTTPGDGCSEQCYIEHPATRFPLPVTNAKGPFLLADKAHTKIADDWADLTDGDLDNPIDINESGQTVRLDEPPLFAVWTNTTPQGSPAQEGDCSAWTSAGMAQAGIGFSNYTDSNWTNSMDPNICGNFARIFCFQVTP